MSNIIQILRQMYDIGMTMVYKIVWCNIHTIVLLTLCIVQWYSQTIFNRVSSAGPVTGIISYSLFMIVIYSLVEAVSVSH